MQNWRPAITTTDVSMEKPNPANAHPNQPAAGNPNRPYKRANRVRIGINHAAVGCHRASIES
jgi:hypothetical protein